MRYVLRTSWIGMLLLLAVGIVSAQGRVTGKVVDEAGKGVTGVTVRFVALEGSAEPRDASSKKKGRFGVARLDPGHYRVDVDDENRFVVRAEFRMQRPDGITVGEGSLDGTPQQGVSGIPISKTNDVHLKLVLAARDSDAARERSLAFALPALATAAEAFNAERFEEALAEAERISADDPDLIEAHYVRGVSLEKLGRYEEAASALHQVAARNSEYENIWANIGEVWMRRATELEAAGRADAASAAYESAAESLWEAARRDDESIAIRRNFAVALDRTGADDRLLPVLEDLLQRNSDDLESRLRLASLHSRNGNHEQAMGLLQDIPTSDKRTAVTIYNIAVRLNEDGESTAALLLARRAAEIDPTLVPAKQFIAQLLLASGDPAEATKAIRAFLEIAPDDPNAATYRKILEQLETP